MKETPVWLVMLLLLVAGIWTAGCASAPLLKAPVLPPQGLLFTSYEAPLTLNFRNTQMGEVKGQGETTYFREPCLGTDYGFGDASLYRAIKDSGLKEVDYIDYEYVSVLGLYRNFRIIPHGKP